MRIGWTVSPVAEAVRLMRNICCLRTATQFEEKSISAFSNVEDQRGFSTVKAARMLHS
jgi:hypothetical protein